jgi:hypothetical protein
VIEVAHSVYFARAANETSVVGDVVRAGGLEVIFDSNRQTRDFVLWRGQHRCPKECKPSLGNVVASYSRWAVAPIPLLGTRRIRTGGFEVLSRNIASEPAISTRQTADYFPGRICTRPERRDNSLVRSGRIADGSSS